MYAFMRIQIPLVVAMLGISSLSDGTYHSGDGNSTSYSTSFHFSGRDQTSFSLSMHPFALEGECYAFLNVYMYVCTYVLYVYKNFMNNLYVVCMYVCMYVFCMCYACCVCLYM